MIKCSECHSKVADACTLQVLLVALLSGHMHYCAEKDGDYLDPYYVLPKGQTINRTW